MAELYNCKNRFSRLDPQIREIDARKVLSRAWRTDADTQDVKNAVLATLTASGHFYVVRGCNSGRIGFPGGNIDASDASIADAAFREFGEETLYKVSTRNLSVSGKNGFRIVTVFVFRGHTAIIVCTIPTTIRVLIDSSVLPKRHIDSHGEICQRFLIRPNALYNISLPPKSRSTSIRHSDQVLRSSAICSTREVLRALAAMGLISIV